MSGFTGQSSSLVAPALAISVVNIDPTNFHNLTFGVSSTNKGSYTEVSTPEHTTTFIIYLLYSCSSGGSSSRSTFNTNNNNNLFFYLSVYYSC